MTTNKKVSNTRSGFCVGILYYPVNAEQRIYSVGGVTGRGCDTGNSLPFRRVFSKSSFVIRHPSHPFLPSTARKGFRVKVGKLKSPPRLTLPPKRLFPLSADCARLQSLNLEFGSTLCTNRPKPAADLRLARKCLLSIFLVSQYLSASPTRCSVSNVSILVVVGSNLGYTALYSVVHENGLEVTPLENLALRT